MDKTFKKFRTVEFQSFEDLKHEINMLKNEGKSNFEVYSPEPLNYSRELKSKSQKRISLFALIGSVIGIVICLYFLYWTSSVDYKMNIGGKEFFNIIYILPLVFEISVLSALIAIVIGFLKKAKLPEWQDDENDLAGKYAVVYFEKGEENA